MKGKIFITFSFVFLMAYSCTENSNDTQQKVEDLSGTEISQRLSKISPVDYNLPDEEIEGYAKKCWKMGKPLQKKFSSKLLFILH